MHKQKKSHLQHIATLLISNDRYALTAVVVLMLIPYTGWLGLSVLALITLRKGWQSGLMLLIPAVTMHTVLSMLAVSWSVGLLDSMFRIVPIFIAACLLRFFGNWRVVGGFFLVFFFLFSLIIHGFFPHWIELQVMMLKKEMTPWEFQGISSARFGDLLLGIESIFLLMTMLIPLFFARSLQARLYYPGGFRHELLNVRGDKYWVIGCFISVLATYYQYPTGLSILPLFLFYFVCTGLSLSAYALSKTTPIKKFLILVLPLVVLPWAVTPFYLVLGVLDSVYNCRWYLSSKIKR